MKMALEIEVLAVQPPKNPYGLPHGGKHTSLSSDPSSHSGFFLSFRFRRC